MSPSVVTTVVFSIVDLSSNAEKRVLQALGFARQVLAGKELDGVAHTGLVSDIRRSLAALTEGSVKFTSSIIPRCTSITTSGFAAASPDSPRGRDDDEFDGTSSKLMRVEFLGVSLLERALINCRRTLLAETPSLRADDALLSATAGRDAHQAMSFLVWDLQRKALQMLQLAGFVKAVVAELQTGPTDIQSIFGLALHEIAAIHALSTIAPQFATAVETLRCVQNGARSNAGGLAARAEEERHIATALSGSAEEVGQSTPVWKETCPAILDGVFGSFRGGTLNHIVCRLTADQTIDTTFIKAVLTTYQSFCTASELLHKVVERYHVPRGHMPPERVTAIKLRCGVVLKHWVELQIEDFDDAFLKELHPFLEELLADGHKHLVESVREDIAARRKQAEEERKQDSDILHGTTALPTTIDPQPTTLVDLLSEVSEVAIAQQLTLLDHELFCRIAPQELLGCAWSRKKTRHKAPHVLALIARSNATSGWVATSVLAQLVLASRVKAVTKCILLAEQLRKMNSYNSMMGVIAGLTTSPINRLKHTWNSLKPQHVALFEQLQAFMDPSGSYRNYREALRTVSACIPYLGTALTDITFMSDGNPDFLEAGSGGSARRLINWKKRELIANVIASIRMQVQEKCPYPRDPILYPALSMLAHPSDDILFDISVMLEPKAARRNELV
jgi:hypothetical protein